MLALVEQCGYSMDRQDTALVIAAPFITCGITVKVNFRRHNYLHKELKSFLINVFTHTSCDTYIIISGSVIEKSIVGAKNTLYQTLSKKSIRIHKQKST